MMTLFVVHALLLTQMYALRTLCLTRMIIIVLLSVAITRNRMRVTDTFYLRRVILLTYVKDYNCTYSILNNDPNTYVGHILLHICSMYMYVSASICGFLVGFMYIHTYISTYRKMSIHLVYLLHTWFFLSRCSHNFHYG